MKATSVGWFVILAAMAAAAPARAEYMFGIRGYDGRDGATGHAGRDGQDVTIDADGTPMMLNLSGSDAGDGEDAYYGSTAMGCVQQLGDFDEVGADGGAGGSGGDGGRGGAAGDITVYADSLLKLKGIFVIARPGRGGEPGRGAMGGQPCRCTQPRWQREVCDSNHQNCHLVSHYCRDGMMGRDGFRGSYGREGALGRVVVIPQKQHLAPVQGEVDLTFADIASGETYTLSGNRWETRSGALGLFGPGSDLSDTYELFKGRFERPVRLHWTAPRPLSDFASDGLSLSLDGEQPKLDTAEGVWAQVDRKAESGATVFTVQAAIHESEAAGLAISRITGSGADTAIELTDSFGASTLVSTEVTKLVFRVKGLLFYHKRFEGAVPSSLVSTEPGKVRIAVGKLGIDAKYLAAGKKARIQLSVSRSFAGHSTEVDREAKLPIGQ